MTKKNARSSSSSRSWREIRQTANRKLVTAHARRRILRNVFRGVLAVTTAIAAAAGVYFGYGYWQEGIRKVNTVVPAQPLREIVVTTDGVLSQAWVERVLALPEDVDTMSIDIHEQRLRLEAHGQVRSALIRRLSDRLVIDLQERSPILRMATQDVEGQVRLLLVDRDGFVYEGIGYDRFEIESLPFLSGVVLHASGSGFRRLAGMQQVDELLTVARSNFPGLYQSWRQVNLGKPPLIRVRSDECREIIFGPGRHVEQLQWLDMIVENNRRQLVGMQERIDLSLGNQVIVR